MEDPVEWLEMMIKHSRLTDCKPMMVATLAEIQSLRQREIDLRATIAALQSSPFQLGQPVKVKSGQFLGDWKNTPLWVVGLHLTPDGNLALDVTERWPTFVRRDITTGFGADELEAAS